MRKAFAALLVSLVWSVPALGLGFGYGPARPAITIGGGGSAIGLTLNGTPVSTGVEAIIFANAPFCTESPDDTLACDFATVVLDTDLDTIVELETRLGVDVYDSLDNFERRIYATNALPTDVLDGADVQARIDAVKAGYSSHSASDPVPLVAMPPGPIPVPTEISCGDGTGTNERVGVQLVGRGSGHAQTTGSQRGVGGTLLEWSGAAGGTIVSNRGCDYYSARDFMLSLDGSHDGDNANDAKRGLVLSARNDSPSATSQMGRIENIGCVGNRVEPDAASPSTASACFEVTGFNQDDQVDGYRFQSLTARYAGYGAIIDNDQFAASVFADSKIYGELAAYKHMRGQLRTDGGLQQCDASGCYVFESSPGGTGAGALTIENPYSELGTGEHFLRITDGSGGAAASRHPITIRGGYISGQCTGTCTHNLVNGTLRGDLTIDGTQLHSDNPNASFVVSLSSASGNPLESPTLHWRPVIHAGFAGISSSSTLSGVTIDALTTADTAIPATGFEGGRGEQFNDLNLNGRPDTDEPILSGGGMFDVCRSGLVKGIGYDAATGTYAKTCGNYNWHGSLDATQATASYYVTCTGRNTPDTACTWNGERMLVGALHRFGVAARLTSPGGKLYLPLFRSATGAILDHAIYVDRGAGTLQGGGAAKYPIVDQWWLRDLYPAAYAKHGPVSRVATIQETFGVDFEVEQKGTLEYLPDPSCPLPDGSGVASGNPADLAPLVCSIPRYRGVWLLNDRGKATSNAKNSECIGSTNPAPCCTGSGTGTCTANASAYLDGVNSDQVQPSHIFIWGGAKWQATAKTTSNSNWTADVEEPGIASRYYESAPLWITGARSYFTTIDPTNGEYCIENGNGTAGGAGRSFDPEVNTSFCANAPMLSCWNSSDVSAATGAFRSTGGCLLDVDADGSPEGTGDDASGYFGPCLGFVDGVEHLKEDLGIDVVLAAEVVQSEDVVSSTADSDGTHGERGTLVPLRFVDGTASCSGTAKAIRPGAFPGYSSGLPIDRLLASSAGNRNVYVTMPSLLQNQGGWRGLGIAPAHRLGQWSPTTSHTGTTSTTGTVSTITVSFATGGTPSASALVGRTITINKGDAGTPPAGVQFRTITANTTTTITWSGGTVTVASGDDFEVTANACMSSLDGGSEWANAQDETACDTESITGIYVGTGSGDAGFTDGAFANISTTSGNKAGLDGWQFGPGANYARNVIFQTLRHSLTDLADYGFDDNVVFGGWSQVGASPLVAIFGSNTHVLRNRFIGGLGNLLSLGTFYNANVVIDGNFISNWSCAGNPLINVVGGRNTQITGNRIEALGNCPVAIQIQATNHKVDGVKIRDNTLTGLLSATAGGDAFVGIGDDGTPPVRQIIVEGNDVSTRNAASCLVIEETSHGADAATHTVRNNDIEGSANGHKAVCIGEIGTVTPSSSAALDTLAYLPMMTGNTENGSLAIGWDKAINTAAQLGDADNLPAGTYYIADDDGTCTDTGLDGTLDGGDTPTGGPAACLWNGSTWNAF